jgi:hypothetical protein
MPLWDMAWKALTKRKNLRKIEIRIVEDICSIFTLKKSIEVVLILICYLHLRPYEHLNS